MSTEIVPPDQTRPAEPRVAPSTSSADRFMRKLLRLPEGRTATADEAHSAFQKSILISAGRCVLMYIFFPFVLPLPFRDHAPEIGHGRGRRSGKAFDSSVMRAGQGC